MTLSYTSVNPNLWWELQDKRCIFFYRNKVLEFNIDYSGYYFCLDSKYFTIDDSTDISEHYQEIFLK